MNKRDNYLILDDLITNDIKLESIHLTKEQEDTLDNGKVIRLDNGAIMARIKGTDMVGEWQNCKSIFSNGTEFELFVSQCDGCVRYRNDHCRVLNACYKAMWDEKAFPYADLQDAPKGYGGKRCRHKTTEPIARKKPVRKQIDGQLTLDF